MSLKKKKPAALTEPAKAPWVGWKHAYPDDRNRLIEEARELIGDTFNAFRKYGITDATGTWMKQARKFLRETKP